MSVLVFLSSTISGEFFDFEEEILLYAIIETGGKQFKVSEGDVITVEKLDVSAGENFVFDKVLAVVGEGEPVFGTPNISGASVDASILGNGKGKKIVVFKYKAKKGYRNKKGHRQPFTKVKIDKINA